ATWTIGQNPMTAIQQATLVEPVEEPPHTLDVLIAARDVRMLVIEPVPDAIRKVFPLRLILEDALPSPGIEVGDTEALDVLLALDAQLLLDLDLYRKPMSVPARDPGDRLPLHRVEP